MDQQTQMKDKPPIFIVGNARSGTTLMQLMLSAHPRIYVCFELSFYNWERASRRFDEPEEFLEAFFTTGGFQWLGIPAQDILVELPSPLRREDLWLAFREMMVQKSARYGRPRWGDKTPGHSKYVAKIFRDFPDARVICMARDPRSAVVSAQRMPWGSSRDLANCWSYNGTHAKLKPYLDHDQVLLVRLEDLQKDPETQMKQVLEFVGEDWDDAVLDHAQHNPDPNPTAPMPWLESARTSVEKPSGDAWEKLGPVRVRTIEKICRKSMRDYGYQRAELDAEPSRRSIRRNTFASVPETVRYLRSLAAFLRYIRKPEHWAWEDEGMHERLYAVNPSCWSAYPGFKWPTLELSKENSAHAAREAAGS